MPPSRLAWCRLLLAALVLLGLPAALGETGLGPVGALRGDLNPLYAQLGPFEDMVVPGFAHEPNHPLDVYPGATHRPCEDPGETLRGACHDYLAHQLGPRLFLDAQARRHPAEANERVATATPGRALPPGIYRFEARVGHWTDLPHRVEESVFLPTASHAGCAATPAVLGLVPHATCAYDVPPDGWVGNVVTTSGQHRWEGFEPTACRMHGVVEVREYAVCSPYRDGWLLDPNGYDDAEGEFVPACGALVPSAPTLVVQPLWAWAAPAFLWMDFPNPGPGGGPDLRDLTGLSGPLGLPMTCDGGVLRTPDALLLPEGNLGFAVTTSLSLGDGRGATARDFDDYVPYG